MEIELRVVLLGVGLIILLVVAYDFFKRKATANNMDPTEATSTRKYVQDYVDPDIYHTNRVQHEVKLPGNSFTLTDDLEEDTIVSDIYTESLQAEDQDEYDINTDPEYYEDKKVDDTRHIITLTIMSRDQYGFEGGDLLAALEGAGLEFGKSSLFHKFEEDQSIFCVVNAMEPGYFMLETLTNEHVPGITLILLPDSVANPVLAFDKLIRAAKQIAFALNGEILDHFKLPLTLETIELYKQEVEAVTKRKI